MIKNYLFLLLFFLPICSFSQTIAEIQGTGDVTPYEDQTVSTTGIVTAKGTQGYFIQDGIEIRSGIYVFDNNNSPEVGDEVRIDAKAVEYFTLTELTTVTNLEVLSSGNPLPEPIVLTTGEANNEDYEGMLITVQIATCTNPDLGFGEWQLDDGSGPISVNDLLYVYAPSSNIDYSVTGPLNYSFDFYKIEPRSADDIVIELPLYFTLPPVESNISQTGMTVKWETNIASSTEYRYGKTTAFELGSVDANVQGTEHVINLENLEPATIYYLQPFSQEEGEMTPNFTMVVCTQSNSSGEVNTYFNHFVDHSVATTELAVSTDHIIDTIIHYINLAEQTLDVTMYETENVEIVDAINAANNRGVMVRVISDDMGNNEAFDNLDQNIGYLEGNADGIMHDKFFIIDAENTENAWVMTGSMNHTINNLGWDYNNIICVQDESLAKAYRLEFNEMWGGTEAQPDLNNSKFGADKTNNTPHHFVIGEIPTELYFSPTDGTAKQIQKVIDNAENEFAFAILVFTENSLGTATRQAHDRGVDVRGIIDYVGFNGSEFNFLTNNGVDVIDYQNADGSQWPDGPTLHHKYAIADYASDKPVLITGSHNWSASANSIHDENTLILYDATLANIYYQEFNARFEGLTPINNLQETNIRLFPNPVDQLLSIDLPENTSVEISNIAGQVIFRNKLTEGLQNINVSDFPDGLYFLKCKDQISKIVVSH